jgi:hypothetical protein
MSARPLVAGVAATAVVTAALGSPAAQDAARDADNAVFARTLTAFPSWDVGGGSGDLVWSVVIRLAVLVVVTGVLCVPAGRAGSRSAALLAGWATAVVAAAVAGTAAYAFLEATVFADAELRNTYLDRLVGAANDGAAYGLWTGWLTGVAVAVAVASHRAPAAARLPAGEPAAAATAEHARISEPPPPWWAPTTGLGEDGTATFRPGPSAFPPGGMPPVVAGVGDGDTYIMSTASGDPHPSDPDATQAVGLEPPPASVPPPAPEPDGDPTVVENPDPTLHLPTQE